MSSITFDQLCPVPLHAKPCSTNASFDRPMVSLIHAGVVMPDLSVMKQSRQSAELPNGLVISPGQDRYGDCYGTGVSAEHQGIQEQYQVEGKNNPLLGYVVMRLDWSRMLVLNCPESFHRLLYCQDREKSVLSKASHDFSAYYFWKHLTLKYDGIYWDPYNYDPDHPVPTELEESLKMRDFPVPGGFIWDTACVIDYHVVSF